MDGEPLTCMVACQELELTLDGTPPHYKLNWPPFQNTPVVGGALDLYKCFDQVIRGLLYVLLLCSGVPASIVSAYSRFQEQSQIYNSISGALGQPHKHHCGIPQGCPLSMIFITFTQDHGSCR